MTDDDPTPEEKRRQLAQIPPDTASALRLAAAMATADTPAANVVIDELVASGRGLLVLAAMGSMASRLAYELAARAGNTADEWLHAVALGLLDETQAIAAALDDDTPTPNG
ncbi:hypothetical protein [Mycobacterium sp. UM_CSW]|uniref:hypothetical protein n=1 Tax=Mycobacterium sp. UM_CSW TaxID=1370119 RepID=UPI0003FEA2C9|nr:hypothetical protein [Mycobacterium sp. UM_CSW]